MRYLLDANTLITAKNDYYAFGLCPGFWQWLEQEAGSGQVLSIERIRTELEQGRDELATWATKHRAFFEPDDQESLAAMKTVTDWVQARDFTATAKRVFFACADPYLIAYALAHGHTLVSHEVHVPGQKNKVKIPTVCLGLNVPCERTFPWLMRRGAVFVLGEAQAVAQASAPQVIAPMPAARPVTPTAESAIQQTLLPDESGA